MSRKISEAMLSLLELVTSDWKAAGVIVIRRRKQPPKSGGSKTEETPEGTTRKK